MPPRHGTGPYANWRHDIRYQKRSQVAAREGTARIARVSFPHGLASQTEHRPATRMASRCNAINDRDSRFISKDWAARRAQRDMRIGTRKSACQKLYWRFRVDHGQAGSNPPWTKDEETKTCRLGIC